MLLREKRATGKEVGAASIPSEEAMFDVVERENVPADVVAGLGEEEGAGDGGEGGGGRDGGGGGGGGGGGWLR